MKRGFINGQLSMHDACTYLRFIYGFEGYAPENAVSFFSRSQRRFRFSFRWFKQITAQNSPFSPLELFLEKLSAICGLPYGGISSALKWVISIYITERIIEKNMVSPLTNRICCGKLFSVGKLILSMPDCGEVA